VPLDTQSMQQIASISGGDFHTASTAEELKSVYSQLSEQIGYETTQQDVSRPWVIAGTMLAIIGSAAALAVSARIP
jgi:Ca-activated chloride channel family protein